MRDIIEQKIKNKEDFIVKFATKGCEPCESFDKILTEDLLLDNIVAVDVKNNYELARDFDVRVIPTMIKFEAGKRVSVCAGPQESDIVKKFLFS